MGEGVCKGLLPPGTEEGEEFEGRGFRLGRGESLEMDVVTAAQD